MSVYVYLHRALPRLWSRFLNYLDIQLFLSLCAWPLLSAWGLPFSPTGIIGNLIFPPFLSLFLSVSSLIFFCELVGIPYGVLSPLLETITNAWSILLSNGCRSWLFIGAHPPFYVTLLSPVIGCILMCHCSFSQLYRILSMSFLILACAFIVPRYQHERNLVLSYEDKELSIIQSQGETVLIDPGILGRRISAPQKIRYTLIPYLITQGIRRVDILVVHKPSLMVFKALATFIEHFPIGTIYLPKWYAAGWSNAGWASWELLVRQAQEYGTTVHLVDKPTTFLYDSSCVTLSPYRKRTKRNKLIYHELMLETQAQGLLNYAKEKETS